MLMRYVQKRSVAWTIDAAESDS